MASAPILLGETVASGSAPDDSEPILQALQHYWGYKSFRPGQEQIVRSIVSGRDAPGGKKYVSASPA